MISFLPLRSCRQDKEKPYRFKQEVDSTVKLEDSEQLFAHPFRCVWIGESFVEKDGFPETVEVGRAIGALSEVPADLLARARLKLCIKLFLQVPCDFPARRSMSMNPLHQVPR
jgi:hypothetical protein